MFCYLDTPPQVRAAGGQADGPDEGTAERCLSGHDTGSLICDCRAAVTNPFPAGELADRATRRLRDESNSLLIKDLDKIIGEEAKATSKLNQVSDFSPYDSRPMGLCC